MIPLDWWRGYLRSYGAYGFHLEGRASRRRPHTARDLEQQARLAAALEAVTEDGRRRP